MLKDLLLSKQRVLSIAGGGLVVCLWTYLRHITNGVNFDVVGQIGMAEQWSRGIHGGAVIGSTNYLLKLPFYFAANSLHFISPMNRLLLLALVFNFLTFLAIFWLGEKLLESEGVKNRSWFYVSMAWLATIAGSVFWVDYANSRNLETIGGVAVIYLVLGYRRVPRLKTGVLLAAVGAVVFFADPLQFYVCGLGAIAYLLITSIAKRQNNNYRQSVFAILAILTGYVGSKIIFYLSKSLLPVSYLSIPTSPLSSENTARSLKNMPVAVLKIFDADFLRRPYTFNALREFLNFIILAGIVYLLVSTMRRRRSIVGGLIAGVMAVNLAIYFLSGQAAQPNTQRYLIMVPIMTVLLVSLNAQKLGTKLRPPLQAWMVFLAISGLLLFGAVLKSWPARHAKDAHIYDTVSFMRLRNHNLAFGTLDQAVTTTYFSDGQNEVLPVDCEANGLRPLNLFYDKGQFNSLKKRKGDLVFILPDDPGAFGPNRCSQNYVTSTFGAPKDREVINGVGTALIYPSETIRIKS